MKLVSRPLLFVAALTLGLIAPARPGAAAPRAPGPLPVNAGSAAPLLRTPAPVPRSGDARVGVSLAGLGAGEGGGVVFVDAMKQASPWFSARPLLLDADGNVTALAAGQSAERVVYRGDAYPGGDYLLLYDGRGRLELDPRSGTVTAAVRGRMTLRITPNPDGIRLRLSATDPANRLRNVRLILPGFAATAAALPFHPLFLRALAPFGVVRFDRWMRAGASPAVAPEDLVALANATGADPWFVFPAGADDAHVARFAALVAARLGRRLTPIFESGSEVWRAGSADNAFAAAGGALSRPGTGPSAGLAWYAARSARVAALVRQAFGPSGRRPSIVVSGPLAVPGSPGEALDRAILAATAGVPDAFAVSASTAGNRDDAFAAGVAASARLAAAARLPLVAYETDALAGPAGGLGWLGAAGSTAARSPAASRRYADVLEAWHAGGGGLAVTEPLVQAPLGASAGGLLERVDQNPLATPKYVGVLTYMARHPMPHVVPAAPPAAPATAAAAHAVAARPAAAPRAAAPAVAAGARRAPGTGKRRLIASAGPPNPYTQTVLADAPIAFYTLDDSELTVADNSPNGHDGTAGTSVRRGMQGLLGCCNTVAMVTPGSATADGIVSIPASPAFQLTTAVSLEALLRFSAPPTDFSVPVGYGSDSAYAPYDLYFTHGGQLNAQFNLTGGVLVVTTPSALQSNTTYAVVATFDGAVGRLYLNGTQVASASSSGTLTGYQSQYGLAIGDDAGLSDPGFAGTVADVAVYGKALSAAQVQAHYRAAVTVPTPAPTPAPIPAGSNAYVSAVLASNPAAYYRSNDAATRAVDASPNHLDGTIGSAVQHGAASLLASTADPALAYPGVANASGAAVFPASSLLAPSTSLSFECFLQFTSIPAAGTVPLAYGTGHRSAPYALYFSGSGTLNAQFTVTSGVLLVTAPTPLRANTPYHIAATYDGAVGRLYVNGVQVATGTQAGSLTGYDASHGLAIGDDAGFSGRAFAGTVEQVAVYSHTLNASQVAKHYGAAYPPAVDWTTFHADAQRTGWNARETQLTALNVNAGSFGLLATLPVDGLVYAEPLVATGETVPGGGKRDLLIVATANDSVYAFDADTGATVWTRSFSGPGVTPVPWGESYCDNVTPTVGIISTPTIDRGRDSLYVVAATDDTSAGTTTTHLRLHALGLGTGADRAAPVDISGSAPQTGGGTIPFLPQWQMSRASLLNANGTVYVAFGSHCDYGQQSAHGWIFAYDATSLAPAGSVFDTTPDPASGQLTLGGIWGSGFGPAADTRGYVYAATGNGAHYDGLSNVTQSVLALGPGLASPALSSFTTANQAAESDADLDLGSGGVMVLPDMAGSTPHLAIAGGKTGITYVLNRDALGGYAAGGPDRVVYEAHTNGGVFGGPAYFVGADGNPYVVISGGNDPVTAFRLQLAPSISLVLASSAPAPIGSIEGGTMPVVSSNGTQRATAVVWALSRPSDTTTPIVLNAYDGADLSHQLFQAPTQPWPNATGDAFVTPTVANGKVYVPTGSTVAVFGLKGSAATMALRRRPSVAVRRAAPLALPRGVQRISGVVTGITGSRLVVRLRDGRSVLVDFTPASSGSA